MKILFSALLAFPIFAMAHETHQSMSSKSATINLCRHQNDGDVTSSGCIDTLQFNKNIRIYFDYRQVSRTTAGCIEKVMESYRYYGYKKTPTLDLSGYTTIVDHVFKDRDRSFEIFHITDIRNACTIRLLR
jgi:hypothetical protein